MARAIYLAWGWPLQPIPFLPHFYTLRTADGAAYTTDGRMLQRFTAEEVRRLETGKP